MSAEPGGSEPRTPRLDLPRVRLRAAERTPLQHAAALSRHVGAQVWLKRDDLTGFGLGGNKVRSLELLLADAESRGCDCLVTGAGPQSNWAFLAALAATVRGLDPYLVRYGDPTPVVGNLALQALLDVDVRHTGDPDRASVDAGLLAVERELRAAGRTPYVLPRGGATALGSVGYLLAVAELAEQLAEAGVEAGQVWLPTGSCGTQAGLVAGVSALGGAPSCAPSCDWGIIGVTVSRPAQECRTQVAELAAGACALVGADRPTRPVRIVDGYAEPGYGIPSTAGRAAAQLLARCEGVYCDPVFGAKALAALLDAAAAGDVAEPVVFLVTGGAPTLFAGLEVTA